MPWFKVDDMLHNHRKLRWLKRMAIPQTRRNKAIEAYVVKLASVGLWTTCGSWASDAGTGGFVPADVVEVHDPLQIFATKLVEVGMWERSVVDAEPGYRFHDWDDYQPTLAEVAAARRGLSDGGQLGNHRRWHADRGIVKPGCIYCPQPSLPDRLGDRPTDRSGDIGGESAPESRANPPVPVPIKTDDLSPKATIRAVLNIDDDETSKILELIKTENQPRALGPYVRKVAAAGDLPALLERVRDAGKPSRASATHDYDPDDVGLCRYVRPGGKTPCALPPSHSTHPRIGGNR